MSLVDSELRYRRLFETAQDGILLVDFKTGKILDVNKFLIDLLGYSKKDFLKKYLWQVGVFKDVAASKANFSTLQNKRYVRFEDLPLETKSGKKIDVEFVANAYQVNGDTIIQCNIRDITDRKEAEEILREEREMFISGNVVIFKWKNESHWPVEYVSENVKEVFGYSAGDFVSGKVSYAEIISKDQLKRVGREVEKASTKGLKNFSHEPYKVIRKDKKVIWLNDFTTILRDKNGKITYYLGYVVDITKRKIAEEKLRESEEKYRLLFNSSKDALMTLEPPSWKFTSGNPAIVEMFGVKDENEFTSLKPWEISPKYQPDGQLSSLKAKKMIQKALDEGTNFFEWTHKKLRGENFYATVLLTRITLDKKVFLQATVRDITKQKIATQAIEESEAQFRHLFENMSSGVVIYETKNNGRDFIIKDFNKAAEKIEKIAKDEVINKSVLKIFPGVKKFGIFKVFQQVWKTGKPQHHPVAQYQDKRITGWRENYVYKLANGNIVAVYDDITQRKIAEYAAQTSELRYRRLFETAQDGILLVDFKTGKILDVNKFLIDLLGYSKKDFLKKYLWQVGVFKDVAASKANFSTLQNKRYVRFEDLPLETKSGKKIDVEFVANAYQVNGDTIIQCNIRDITDRKEIERQALNRIQDIYNRDEAILNSIGDGVIACDNKGKIFIFNFMAEVMTGVSAKKAIGRHYNKTITFINELTQKSNNKIIYETIKKNRVNKMANHTLLLRNDGQKIPIISSAAPIKNADGKIIGCVVVFHDITKERQVDKAKTEFVSLASHQLRTPLSTINWYSEILMSEDVGELTLKQEEHVSTIHQASKRMGELVNALLNVSRLELGTFAVEPKSIDIVKVAEACLEELTPQIKLKKIILTRAYGKNIGKHSFDPKLLTIILQNLLSNSVKYTDSGGKIALAINKQKDGIKIEVSDTGAGIPKHQQKNIFEKLFRADNAKKIDQNGTGLGLYIVKEIVDHSGGKVWFESQEKGTTFYVNYPLSKMIKKIGTKQLT